MNHTLEQLLSFRRTLSARPPLSRTTVRARGLDFAVYRTPAVGDALPLLCINGGLLFSHELLWPALAALAKHRQLIFYDQRGRGASQTPPGLHASRIEFDATDVRAIREALGISQWDVLGHSWGGGIAMLATANDAAAVRNLVLVCSVGVTSRWLPTLHREALDRLVGAQREALAGFNTAGLNAPDLAYHAAYAKAFFPAYFADREFAASVTPAVGTSVTGTFVAARLRREGYDWTSSLRDVTTRTLVLHGTGDIVPQREAEDIAATLKHASLRLMPDVGHNPFWEAPTDFFALVEAFLAEPPLIL